MVLEHYLGGIIVKRFISIIISLVLLLNLSNIVTYADDEIDGGSDMAGTSSVMFVYLRSITASIYEKPLGFIKCVSQFKFLSEPYTIVVTCALQRTDGSSGWVVYKSASQTFSNELFEGLEKSWFAPAGYAYRTHTKVQVKNSSGTVIETQTINSSVIYK